MSGTAEIPRKAPVRGAVWVAAFASWSGRQIAQEHGRFPQCSACPPAFVPADPTNIKDMLQILVDAERCAVRGYTEVCNMTFGKDHRTYNLALAILHEEIEDEAWFSRIHRRWAERACAPKIGREFSLCR